MTLTSTGLVVKTLQELKDSVEASLRANLGPGVNLQSDSLWGQFVGIVCALLAEENEVTEAVYASQYPDSASGISLDRVGSITGAVRLPATRSTGTLLEGNTATASGTPGTVLPVGRIIKTAAGDRFQTTAEFTIGVGGAVEIEYESVEFGEIPANAATLNVIETPVAGWASVTNADDVTLGTEIETDAAFRLRRVQLLARAGDATVDAIRSDVLAVSGVTEAFVFENTDLVTDADGVPGKSFEVVVSGGDATEIATAIFNSKPAGILAYGQNTEIITDSQGFDHEIGYTRPEELDIEIDFDVSVTSEFPADGEDQLKEAFASFINGLRIGRDLVTFQLISQAFGVAGVFDLPGGGFNIIGDPPAGNIEVGPRQRVVIDTSDITLNITVVPIT